MCCPERGQGAGYQRRVGAVEGTNAQPSGIQIPQGLKIMLGGPHSCQDRLGVGQ
jgi:hypothetical protein